LARAFESPILKAVEDFMHRNIAQSLSTRQLRQHDKDLPPDQHYGVFFGQVDAPWLAIADYFASVHGNEHCQKLEGLIQAVQSCGFVGLTPHNVHYCNRPEIAKFDNQGRLHCDDGPAIQYRGGLKFFYLHGIPVPIMYIETPADKLKLDEVLAEENSAVRMAVIEKFGFARLLDTVQHRVVSEAEGNSLIQVRLNYRSGVDYFRLLRVKWQDKTGSRETMLPVPRLRGEFGADAPENIHDCEQVRRWTLGWPREAMAVAET
jgi:hypothetical protein